MKNIDKHTMQLLIATVLRYALVDDTKVLDAEELLKNEGCPFNGSTRDIVKWLNQENE